MAFYWKIELTSNQMQLLLACEKYTDRVDALSKADKKHLYRDIQSGQKGANYPSLWSDLVFVEMRNMRHGVTVSKALHEDGLLESEGDTWRVSKRGRQVIDLIRGEIVDLKQETK